MPMWGSTEISGNNPFVWRFLMRKTPSFWLWLKSIFLREIETYRLAGKQLFIRAV